MTSPIKLISVHQIAEVSDQEEFFWIYQTNTDPWNTTQIAEWTPYPHGVSSAIEKAFRRGSEQIFIDEMYRIDLEHLVQEHIDDRNRQRPIRRRRRSSLNSSISSDEETESESCRRERLSFHLGLVSARSTTVDTNYHGLPFVTDWVLIFTKGEMNVTFDSIFPVLVQGLEQEGQTESTTAAREIVDILNKVRDTSLKKKETKRMKDLQDCCAKLYTKDCYIYRVINTALRGDDRTKLNTLGPYCYLVYNYIGQHVKDYLSIRHRLQEILHPTESRSMIVYRGDYISRETIEEYRQAAGDNSKYFKWLPFVSTSLDRDVAESFGCNVLYIIELQRYLSNDQFANLKINTYKQSEEEILLRPGVRFRVDKVKFDGVTGRQLVYIKVVPSYVSNLR
jgi:hypothetical protein